MGIFDRLFGSDDAIKTAADGIYHGIDAAVFTSEEKGRHFLSLLKAYEPFKLAQRLLALIVGIPYVVTWIAAAWLYVAGAIGESVVMVDASQKLAQMNNDTLGTQFAIILVFYFGGGAVEGAVRARSK